MQHSQTEKYKMLSQEAKKKSEGLQQEVISLEKVPQMLVSFISWKGKKTLIKSPSIHEFDGFISNDPISVSISDSSFRNCIL